MKFLRNVPLLALTFLISETSASARHDAPHNNLRASSSKSSSRSLQACGLDCGLGVCVMTTTVVHGFSFQVPNCQGCEDGSQASLVNGAVVCAGLDQEYLSGSSGSTTYSFGDTSDPEFGYDVANLGDINGDGIDDLIIGSPGKSIGSSLTYSGVAYVVFGSISATISSATFGALDGTNGFIIKGSNTNDRLGISVSSAGDINDDGIPDIMVGVPGEDHYGLSGAGAVYVIFGGDSSTEFPSSIGESDLDGTVGFIIRGDEQYGDLGTAISNAGDVNGDGVDDIILGAPRADPNSVKNAGKAYVVFGSSTIGDLDVSNLNGSNGFAIEGIAENGYLGLSVSGAGDINGDGESDVIVGAPFEGDTLTGQGGAYVVFGSTAGFSSSLRVDTLDGSDGFVIHGLDQYDVFGSSVASAGDVNGDGVDDFIVGAPRADRADDLDNTYNSGEAYVFYGQSTFSGSMSAGDADSIIYGKSSFDGLGYSVGSAGDMNGDGVDDLVIGAPYGDSTGNKGEIYIIYGSTDDLPLSIEIDGLSLADGEVVTLLPGTATENNGMDIAVAGGGDFNSDGNVDLLVGLPNVETPDDSTANPYDSISTEGQVYVVLS